jgi:hypothetical protein
MADVNWLFWSGTAICTMVLAMNLASGAMNFPLLPSLFMIAGAVLTAPWYSGVAKGLVAWTIIESFGELYVAWRKRPK